MKGKLLLGSSRGLNLLIWSIDLMGSAINVITVFKAAAVANVPVQHTFARAQSTQSRNMINVQLMVAWPYAVILAAQQPSSGKRNVTRMPAHLLSAVPCP